MKTLHLFLGLSVASLLVMLVIDAILGPKAEFVNAFSVVQRIVGQTPTSGSSLAAQKFGAVAELVFVLVANLIIGGGLTALTLVRVRAKR